MKRRENARMIPSSRFRWEAEQLHDYVLFCANTGLRPDEAMRLEFRDVTVIEDEGICLRLLEGADIYQIAKNCRTSVEMIEKYYAAHLKTQLDASAINVMRPRPKKKAISKKGPGRVEAIRLAEEA
jgi:integrase